jgi:predicted ArsR family transcriptional regulator
VADAGALEAVATLGDDMRRRLYGFARAARRPVSRDEAAVAIGISRKLAAFHLDKLVAAGLLQYRFHSAGVGRPAKVYLPSDSEIQVSIPARRHEVLADILAQAVMTENQYGSAKAAAEATAGARGLAAGMAARDRLRPGRLGAERALTAAEEILSRYGFEPCRVDDTCVRLRNCPFHPLARDLPDLVCQLNHAFIRGIVEGLQASTVDAVLAPATGECCVELRRALSGTAQSVDSRAER